LIAAAYLHRMSRSLDPQLHTHVVAATSRAARTAGSRHCTVRRCIGRQRPPAISTKPPARHDHRPTRSRVGEVRKGAAELAGVPSESSLSFRSAVRDAARGRARWISLNTKAGGEAAALATRDSKDTGSTRTPGAKRSKPARRNSGSAAMRSSSSSTSGATASCTTCPSPTRQTSWCWATGSLVRAADERANSFDERFVLQEFAARPGRADGRSGPRAGRSVHRRPMCCRPSSESSRRSTWSTVERR